MFVSFQTLSPFDRAMAAKNKGNKYFRGGRYELAIKCYSDAIDKCPVEKATDLATFYQNRAAAQEQMDNDDAVYKDCCEALRLNVRYRHPIFFKVSFFFVCVVSSTRIYCLKK